MVWRVQRWNVGRRVGFLGSNEDTKAHRGWDMDKAAAAGRVSLPGELPGTACHAEACLVTDCRQIYSYDIDLLRCLDAGIETDCPRHDQHGLRVGNIANCRASWRGRKDTAQRPGLGAIAAVITRVIGRGTAGVRERVAGNMTCPEP